MTGWVDNQPDDSVEIEAEGPSAVIEAFTDMCRSGPISAEIERTDIAPLPHWAIAARSRSVKNYNRMRSVRDAVRR